MELTILEERGYEQALWGLGLSYGLTSGKTIEAFMVNRAMVEKLNGIAVRLAGKDTGENGFLEMLQIWCDIRAPRFWWSHFDRYRVGVSRQSESTMHTLLRAELAQTDFEMPIPEDTLSELNFQIRQKNIQKAKAFLPEGFLQRRAVRMDYMAIRRIILQRRAHRLDQWRFFCLQIYGQAEHRDLLPEPT